MKKISFTKILIIVFVKSILIYASCPIILAQEIEQQKETVEPILTEETLPNEVGEWDIRFSIDYLKINEEINVTLPQIQLFFGLFENLGAEFSMPLNYRKSETAEYGLGSISTSLKWLFIEQSSFIPALVLGLEVGFPTNSFTEDTEERSYELSPFIAFLKNFGELSVQGNLAETIEFPYSGGEKNYLTEFNIAFIYPVIEEKLFLLAEMNSSWSKKEQNVLYIAPGIKYNINDEDFLALAFPINLDRLKSDFRFILQYQLQL